MSAEPKPPPKLLPPEHFILDADGIVAQVDFVRLFGNDHPVELEIGCGKAGFLLRLARDHPERNFIGVEWANKYYKYAADRMFRWQVLNARLVRTDARDLIMNQTPPASISCIHCYHPDPWPKARHHKRRIFCPDSVEAMVRVLKPGGRIAVQSDHSEYFGVIQELLTARPELEPSEFADAEYGTPLQRTETNFEIKYLREGRTIHRLALRRKPDST